LLNSYFGNDFDVKYGNNCRSNVSN
jgi:hypothetical protein